ncbi:MAG: HEAT repeat domain-containing protein [Elusimicrobiota bacterium]
MKAALLLLLPCLCWSDDGDWSERIRAVNAAGDRSGSSDEGLRSALSDPDWQVRFAAVHWLGRRGAQDALKKLLGSEACPLVRMTALHWLAKTGAEPQGFDEKEEDLSGCESWFWPVSKEYAHTRGRKAKLVVATPPDSQGCVYARYKRAGRAACPEGTVAKGVGPAPGSVDFLKDTHPASGVALCCPPGRDLASAAEQTPLPQEAECRLIPDQCPAGWVEMEPEDDGGVFSKKDAQHRRDKRLKEGDLPWLHCCRKTEAVKPMKPQPPVEIRYCEPEPQERIASLPFDEGLRELEPPSEEIDDDMPEREIALAASAKREQARKPKPLKTKPKKQAPLPLAGLVKSGEHDPSETSGGVAALLDGMRSAEARKRERSALALAGMGPRAASALPGLTSVLKGDPSPRVRACAALALASITRGKDDAVPYLSGALFDPHPGVRTSAAQSLGKIGTPRAEQTFLRYMQAKAETFIRKDTP